MSTLVTTLQGRFGNQCMQWLFCYAYALKNGMKFECDEWVGERIFDLPKYDRPSSRAFDRVNEISIHGFPFDCEYRGYAQCQSCMIYTKRQAKQWLKLRPEIEAACKANYFYPDKIVLHRRVGDFIGYGYPVVSLNSYRNALHEYGFDETVAQILSEENPTLHFGISDDLGFMPDFYRMMKAPTLLRANSSFSWVAGLLSDGIVLSPVIDGLEGGKEHDVRFQVGNYCRLANFDFTTELHVAP